MLPLLHCPPVYLMHGPTFRNKWALVTEAVMGSATIAGCLHALSTTRKRATLIQNNFWWPDLPAGDVEINESLLTARHEPLGFFLSSRLQHTCQYITLLCVAQSTCQDYRDSAFQQSNEPDEYSNINLLWSFQPPGTRRGWKQRTGNQQPWVSTAPVTHTHPSSLYPAAKCAKKTATSPTQRDVGEFNCCYLLIKGSQWGWLGAEWSQWEALP